VTQRVPHEQRHAAEQNGGGGGGGVCFRMRVWICVVSDLGCVHVWMYVRALV
jgi:hypothetical protein